MCAGIVYCAWTDFKYGRVFNGCVLFLAFAGTLLKGTAFWVSAIPFLLAGMCLFRFRVMGAGDGKLMAVIGGYLGLKTGFSAVALGFSVGAVWSLWKMKRYGLAAERFCYLKTYVETTVSERKIRPYDVPEQPRAAYQIPFAVCLAAGVLGYLAVSCLYGI